jgi:glycosyltransferase involved in cell wall biosynthesis
MQKSPLVSVIMPVYNPNPTFFEIAIHSILSQTYQNLELIIINDGTNNGYDFSVLKSYDKRIKIIDLNQNKGISNALNIAIKNSDGKYIARMDADDVSRTNRILNQVKQLNKHYIVSSGVNIIDCNGITISKSKSFIFHNSIRRFQLYNLAENPVNHPTIMARRVVFEEFNYDSKFDGAEDFELWLRMRNNYKIFFDKEHYLDYRVCGPSNDKKKQEFHRIVATEYFRNHKTKTIMNVDIYIVRAVRWIIKKLNHL